jgi:hypothetical protein
MTMGGASGPSILKTCSAQRLAIHRIGARIWAVQQRFLTDDEINDAKAMIGWQFWAAPIIFVVVSVGLGIGALGGNPAIVFVFLLVCSLTIILFVFRFRDYRRVNRDIEIRVVEVIEGAPEMVWIPRSVFELTRSGFCYLRLAGTPSAFQVTPTETCTKPTS